VPGPLGRQSNRLIRVLQAFGSGTAGRPILAGHPWLQEGSPVLAGQLPFSRVRARQRPVLQPPIQPV